MSEQEQWRAEYASYLAISSPEQRSRLAQALLVKADALVTAAGWRARYESYLRCRANSMLKLDWANTLLDSADELI